MGEGDNERNLKVEKENDKVPVCLHTIIPKFITVQGYGFWQTGRLHMNGREIWIC